MGLAASLRAQGGLPCRPWPRHPVSPGQWSALGAEAGLSLVALWGDALSVHALWRDAEGMLAVSVPVADGRYPALSPQRPGAILFERALRDLWGHAADGALDHRPWLDHGAWEVATPLVTRPPPHAGVPPEAAVEGMDQVPIGPMAGGIAEAGQFRLFVRGGRIARVQARLGWLHKGIPALMRGKSPRAASRFAARLAGDAPVAHAIAFARAAEAASDTLPPPRALALRAASAEAERIAMHLADIAALAAAAGAPLVAAHCQAHREALLRAGTRAFGHRLMMDVVVPGGLATDIAPEGVEAMRAAAAAVARDLAELGRLCAPLLRRLEGLGVVPPKLAMALSAGGPSGRACGAAGDLRRSPGYRPYHDLNVAPVREAPRNAPRDVGGDAAARLLVWLAELRDSARMVRTALTELPAGEIVATLPMVSGEGFGWAEGPRGGIWTWLRLEGGQIAQAFQRDPGWLHLPMLEGAARGADLADWPLLRASFGISHAGMDQ